MKHPAPYTDALLPVFARLLLAHAPAPGPLRLLDPFAGTGKIARLRHWVPHADIIGIEIEPEWARLTPGVIVANALRLPFPDRAFDAVVTSPTYGNRMADHHNARDDSPRHTYRHTLGRALHPANSGQLQWGDAYRALHRAAWTECRRVLRPAGLFILNIKDHIRHGQLQHVSAWHIRTLRDLGFTPRDHVTVPCPGQRHGANAHLRVDHEHVILFVLSPTQRRSPATSVTGLPTELGHSGETATTPS